MEASNNVDGIIERAKEQAVGKAPQPGPMHVSEHSWKMQRVLDDSLNLVVNFCSKLRA